MIKWILVGVGCGLLSWGGLPIVVTLGALFICDAFLIAIEELGRKR
jgi:hypothetical protein